MSKKLAKSRGKHPKSSKGEGAVKYPAFLAPAFLAPAFLAPHVGENFGIS